MTSSVKIAPSILSADLARLGEEVQAVTRAGADYIHVDVMDGHFVPPITFGHHIVKAIRPLTDLPIDVHLMISPVDPHIEAFAEAGANMLTVHPEAGPHLHRTLTTIRSHGMKAGVALNPATPINCITSILPAIDLILIMTVNPGFGGQSFIFSPVEKIRELRRLIDSQNLPILLEVDGGINSHTAPTVIDAGIDIIVAGTAIFGQNPEQYAEAIRTLKGN
jgi:ribulose-phosphate 3-epimerase